MVETDAVRAGQEPAGNLSTLISNLLIPMVFTYYFVIPTLFPKKASQSEPEIPIEPVSWTWFFIKFFGGIIALAIAFLLMIYFK